MKNLNKKLLFISILILTFPLLVKADKQCPSTAPFGCSCDWWNIVCWLGCIFQFLLSIPIKLPFLIIAAIGIVVALMGGILLLIVQLFVEIVTNASIVATGDLANSIKLILPIKEFSLHLIYIFLLIIGIATIFRIAEYQAKKALVPLIIVALLINFTGPITQEVVNIGNSLTNYFLTQIKNYTGGSLALIDMGILWQSLMDGLGALWGIFVANGSFFDCIVENLTIIGILSSISFVMAIFFFAAAIILGVFGLVFLARIVFVYLLYIVAPIAFATAAFGKSIPGEIKSIFVGPLNFDGWWKDILEWSFIGVALTIWLFLAMYLLKATPINITISDNALASLQGISLEQSQKIIEPINKLIKYLAPLVALFIGVKTAPGMMGQMAQQAFNMAKTAVTTGAIILGTAATAGIAAGAGAIGGAAGAAKAAGAGRLGTLGAGIKAVPSAIKTGFSTAARTTLGKGLPELVKPIPKEIREEIAAVPWVARRKIPLITKREEAEKFAEETYKQTYPTQGMEGMIKAFKSPGATSQVKEALLGQAIKEKKLDEMLEDEAVREFLKTPRPKTRQAEIQKEALKIRPDLAMEFTNPDTKQPWRPEDIIKKLTPRDVLQIKPKVLIKPEIFEALTPSQSEAIIRRGTEEQKIAHYESFLRHIQNTEQIPVYNRYQRNVQIRGMSQREALISATESQLSHLNKLLQRLESSNDPRKVARGEHYERLLNTIFLQR